MRGHINICLFGKHKSWKQFIKAGLRKVPKHSDISNERRGSKLLGGKSGDLLNLLSKGFVLVLKLSVKFINVRDVVMLSGDGLHVIRRYLVPFAHSNIGPDYLPISMAHGFDRDVLLQLTEAGLRMEVHITISLYLKYPDPRSETTLFPLKTKKLHNRSMSNIHEENTSLALLIHFQKIRNLYYSTHCQCFQTLFRFFLGSSKATSWTEPVKYIHQKDSRNLQSQL